MRHEQLQKTLNNLVTNFGYEDVRKTLSGMRLVKVASTSRKMDSGNAVVAKPTTEPGKKRYRPNAVKFVQSLSITDDEKKKILFSMAEKYEAKEFMPNVNHVRGFLIKQDKDVTRIKSRQQVTISVFKLLADLETSKLCEMVERGMYAPTKRLAPYARAIEGFRRPNSSA